MVAVRYSLYNKRKGEFERKVLEMLSQYIGYEPRTCEYVLHNGREVFARIDYCDVAEWCKEMGMADWHRPCEDCPIPPDYVNLFFANMVFGQVDLELMTDAHVVRSCLRRYVNSE